MKKYPARFKDRKDAGRKLAEKLAGYREDPVVLALPRGGVPVGYEISRSLGAPLDVFVARKLGAPGREELGIGAVTQGGVRVLNQHAVEVLDVSDDYIEWVTEKEIREIERRLRVLRGSRGPPECEVGDRTVILVDDGLATGVTALAAVEALRQRSPRRLVLAAPVCAAPSTKALRPKVDELTCLETPLNLGAIGLWYENFYQVPDEEVAGLLECARRARENPDPSSGP